jgi:hypothetical protein
MAAARTAEAARPEALMAAAVMAAEVVMEAEAVMATVDMGIIMAAITTAGTATTLSGVGGAAVGLVSLASHLHRSGVHGIHSALVVTSILVTDSGTTRPGLHGTTHGLVAGTGQITTAGTIQTLPMRFTSTKKPQHHMSLLTMTRPMNRSGLPSTNAKKLTGR